MKEYKWFYETCRVIVRLIVPLLIRLRVIGVENVPRTGPVILVSNHLNWTDIPMIGLRVMRRTHFMAKSELFQKAPLKWLVIGLGAFPVRRGEADRQAIKQAEEVLKAGQVLVIFPEGTRSRSRKMKAGLAGVALIALRSGAPVVPVGIYGSEKFKPWHIWPFRTSITLTYGEPFILTREGQRGHTNLQEQLDSIMRRIAALVPPEYRGIYGEDASGAALAAGAPAAVAESAPVQLQPSAAQEAEAEAASGSGE
ncbi:MAG TPA: lysophospholipid acyltransferase family protein [Ktedonobacterales bacterium]|nr:lysophospholipid acyltransferase family protein [Ktedonobacterales bacterium]